jgi:hypothetical protein
MLFSGNISKMRSEYGQPVHYFLPVGDQEIAMNGLIGRSIRLRFTGQINCIACGKKTKTSFSQGFCYSCLQTSPEASETVTRPELSKAHLGIARDMDWSREHDLIEHVVYLALSSDLKVGVTRHHQVPTRWIDQGASFAIELCRTPNRHIAGVIEVWLKKHFTDKTNWRAMLQNQIATNIDLLEEKKNALQLLTPELQKYYSGNHKIWEIEYPVQRYPEKITSITFDKTPEIAGILTGIKGQYLIFGDGSVLNIRKHNGYWVEVTVE